MLNYIFIRSIYLYLNLSMKHSFHNLKKEYLFLIQVFIYIKNISNDIIFSSHIIHIIHIHYI